MPIPETFFSYFPEIFDLSHRSLKHHFYSWPIIVPISWNSESLYDLDQQSPKKIGSFHQARLLTKSYQVTEFCHICINPL